MEERRKKEEIRCSDCERRRNVKMITCVGETGVCKCGKLFSGGEVFDLASCGSLAYTKDEKIIQEVKKNWKMR